jgi:hypothetical protein
MQRLSIPLLYNPLSILLVLSVVMNATLWFLAMTSFPHSEPAAVLHYSTEIGIDFIGEGSLITVLPLIGSIILVGNVLVGLLLKRADNRAAWILWSVPLVAQIVLFVAFYLLWRINI